MLGSKKTFILLLARLESPIGTGCLVELLLAGSLSLGLHIAQSRQYFYTLGPKVGIIYILGALGYLRNDSRGEDRRALSTPVSPLV